MSYAEDLIEEIKNAVQSDIESEGFILFEINIRKHQSGTDITLLVDRPLGGITLDECSRVNKQVIERLETEAIMQDSFSLEVSSPGLDRPLKTARDFLRVVNNKVEIFLSAPVEDKVTFAGKLKKVEDNEIYLEGQDSEFVVPIEKINKGIIII